MPVTLKQIAAHSGVSAPTVSLVLNDKGPSVGLKPETCRRVTRIARELGYRPNAAVKAMHAGRFNSVGLLLSSRRHRSSLFSDLLDGIHDTLADHGLHLVVTRLSDGQLTDESYMPRILREWSCDGLLINYSTDIPPRMTQLIRQFNIPSIWMNSKQEADCVYPDDFDAGRRAAQHLIKMGHQRVMFISYSGAGHYSSEDRAAGYEAAMRDAGLAPRTFQINEPGVPRCDRVALAGQLLARADRPTAMITYSPSTAWPILRAAERRAGLNVPGDLSIITFSDVLADLGGLAIDTMLAPEYALGRTAVEMLQKKIDDPKAALPPRALPFGFAAGETCATADSRRL